MEFTLLKKHLAEVRPFGIYILEGEDGFLRTRGQHMLISAADVQFSDMNISYVDGEFSTAKQLIQSAGVLPFISERRVLVVREYHPKAADINALKDGQVAKLAGENCLIIFNNRTAGDLKKAFKECTVVDCSYQPEGVVAQWAISLLRAEGLEISPAAALKLARGCGRDMQRMQNEIQKLAVYCQNRVTEKDIEATVAQDSEYQVFKLSSLIAAGDGRGAYDMINGLGKKGDMGYVPMFLGLLGNYYRRLYYVKSSTAGDEQLATALKIKPYAVKMLRKDSANMSAVQARRCAGIAEQADLDIKSGKMAAETALKYAVGRLLEDK